MAGPKFADHFLCDNGIEVRIVDVEVLQIKARLKREFVVTGDAGLLDDFVRLLRERSVPAE
ncbi:MAG: hypothetical protein HOI35_11405 [Woeseia sp.]|nr:hypothetical protein [Woeseia sp.]